MAKIILSDSWMIEFCKNLALDSTRIRRVIIDCQVKKPIMVYVEQFGTKEMLDFTPPDLTQAMVTILGD